MALALLDKKQALYHLTFKPGPDHKPQIVNQAGHCDNSLYSFLHGKITDNMVGLPADGWCRLFTHEKYLLPLIFAVYHDAGVKRYFAPADIEWNQHC